MRYFVAEETLHHPETYAVILERGERVTRKRVVELMAVGVDQIKGYWCATLGAVDDAQKRIANSDAMNA